MKGDAPFHAWELFSTGNAVFKIRFMTTPPEILYKYLDAEGAIKTLENHTLKFSSPLELNDPFEFLYGEVPIDYVERLYDDFSNVRGSPRLWKELCKEKLGITNEEEAEEKRQQRRMQPGEFKSLIKRRINLRKDIFQDLHREFVQYNALSCFSEDPKNILMWGHYADKYKGCVIGFDPTKFSKWHKVDYQPKRVSMLDFSDDDGKKSYEATKTTKATEWFYEREWRLISHISNLDARGGLLVKDFEPSSAIKEIIVGLRADNRLRQMVLHFKAKKCHDCELKYLVLQPEDFALDIVCPEEMIANKVFSSGAHP